MTENKSNSKQLALTDAERNLLDISFENELYKHLVPLALETYMELLTSKNETIKKQTADAIMELAGKTGQGPKAIHQSMNFQLPPEMMLQTLKGLEKVIKGAEE